LEKSNFSNLNKIVTLLKETIKKQRDFPLGGNLSISSGKACFYFILKSCET